MRRKICVITGTRAEYGLLQPLMSLLVKEQNTELQIIATGMHLAPEFGLTYQEIEKDGFTIDRKVEMLLSSDSPAGIAKSMGLGISGFADAFQELKPDILVILGDRFEIFAAVCSAVPSRIPVAHIHGGETTIGAVDEAFRHSITKMSHLHFTSTEEYRQRVIQLGEHPDRVFNVGAIGLENIRGLPLLSKEELAREIGFDLDAPYFLVTFHPVTLEQATAEEQFQNLLLALDQQDNTKIIFTKANADTEGRIINQLIDSYVAEHPDKSIAYTSMGQLRYLSAMKHCSAVVGNSSSGIIEAPSFRVPTVNIGDRQKGRVRAESVIDSEPRTEQIKAKLEQASSESFNAIVQGVVNPYEKPGTAREIAKIIKKIHLKEIIKKEFYDHVPRS